ncbi:MAG: hypothetical protein U5Q44_07645 [Dehalococcoidia bacterium]|nr:hypothetical protein [Dehalococcoidia bacterium]
MYEEYIAPRNLSVHRTEHLWNAQTFRQEEGTAAVHRRAPRNAEGEARGFGVRTSEDDNPDIPGPNQDMEVVDLVYLDLDAYAGIGTTSVRTTWCRRCGTRVTP